MTNCKARVESARYKPLTRSAANAKPLPMIAAVDPARMMAISQGIPNLVACTAA